MVPKEDPAEGCCGAVEAISGQRFTLTDKAPVQKVNA
jgi:hypothetical protein